MKAVYFPNQSIFLRENGGTLQNILGSRIVSTVNETMIEGAADLRGVLVELLLVVFVEVMEVDGVWTEIKVIEWGDADVLVHERTKKVLKTYQKLANL